MMKTIVKQSGVYYGMYVYTIVSETGQRVELPPSVEPTIEGLTALLANEAWQPEGNGRELVQAHLLALTKAAKIAEIDAYDTSEAVNSFRLDGMGVWLPYELRSKLSDRLPAEEAAGRTVTTLWLGSVSFTMPITMVRQLLTAIEVYAADCYDTTARHKAAVEALDTVEAVNAYDYTQGYPARLELTTNG